MDCKNSRVNRIINLKTLSIISVAVICVLSVIGIPVVPAPNSIIIGVKFIPMMPDLGRAYFASAVSCKPGIAACTSTFGRQSGALSHSIVQGSNCSISCNIERYTASDCAVVRIFS